MLLKISLRNAKRQAKHYVFYFITITVSFAIMLGFHSLIFSDMISKLPSLEVLPYFILFASILVIFILGWLICYMSDFMLKSRSKEFGIYMLLGLSKQDIKKMLMRENLVVGLAASIIGSFFGILLSKLLEHILLGLFGISGGISFGVSPYAFLMTLLFFFLIYFYAMRRSIRILRKKSLRTLLLYEKENEAAPNKKSSPLFFIISVLLCILGGYFLIFTPIGKGFDFLLLLICFSLSIFLFYKGLSSFLFHMVDKYPNWKYQKNRLLIFRMLAGKISTSSATLGILSLLFTIAIIAVGSSISINYLEKRNMESFLFDIVILQDKGTGDPEKYIESIQEVSEITGSHFYPIYQTGLDIITSIYTDFDDYYLYKEYAYDTAMAYSDYVSLCTMLNIDYQELEDTEYSIHCTPEFKTLVNHSLEQVSSYNIKGHSLQLKGIQDSNFNQLISYGNGYLYILILPDYIAENLRVVYRLNSIMTESDIDFFQLSDLVSKENSLYLLNRNMIVSKGEDSYPGYVLGSSLYQNGDYLSGKWAYKSNMTTTYSILLAFVYFAFILEITGAAIISTQILSDVKKDKWYYHMLSNMGASQIKIERVQKRYIRFYFLVPILPALMIGCSSLWCLAYRMNASIFPLASLGTPIWIIGITLVTLILFFLLYGIYYGAVTLTYKAMVQEGRE